MDSIDALVRKELQDLGFPLEAEIPAMLSSSTDAALETAASVHLKVDVATKPLHVALLAEDLLVTEKQLKQLGAHITVQASSHLQMHRNLPQDMLLFLTEVKQQAPHLVWIQYRGAGLPGRRAQVRNFRHFVQDLLQAAPQVALLIECRASDLPVREEIMQHASWDHLLRPVCVVRSCTLNSDC
eukprot:3930833-Amphidinium_carterae.1